MSIPKLDENEERRKNLLELKAYAERELASIDGNDVSASTHFKKKKYSFELNNEGKIVVSKRMISEEGEVGGMMTSAPYMEASLHDPTSNQAAYGIWSGYVGKDKKPVKKKHKLFFDKAQLIDFTKTDNWTENLEDYSD